MPGGAARDRTPWHLALPPAVLPAAALAVLAYRGTAFHEPVRQHLPLCGPETALRRPGYRLGGMRVIPGEACPVSGMPSRSTHPVPVPVTLPADDRPDSALAAPHGHSRVIQRPGEQLHDPHGILVSLPDHRMLCGMRGQEGGELPRPDPGL